MALDDRYIVDLSLCDYFVDKTTGAPLSNGYIEFYQDNNRTLPKLVYELVGTPPNYSYLPLPVPLALNDVGVPINNDEKPISIYYYPYDDFGNIQLYYIQVFDENGLEQKTIEAWPNLTAGTDPTKDTNAIVNLISNPQFAYINFPDTFTYTFAAGGSAEIPIAPDWTLELTYADAGNIVITRTAIAGSANYPTQAPYKLTVIPGTNLTSIKLRQRLYHNPSIWAPTAPNSDGGFVSAGVTLETGSSMIIYYRPNSGTQQILLNENNSSGATTSYSTTTQLLPGDNSTTATTGYVDIVLNLSAVTATTFTSVQMVSLEGDIDDVPYDEQPVNREGDYLFHTYNPMLQYKPIPSYLIGWDFPMNPAQLLGDTVTAQAVGANKSFYVWDQTIAFQSVDSGISFSRTAMGALRMTFAQNGQAALIQYLEAPTVNKILAQKIAVNAALNTSIADGITCTISLWYTSDATLPNVATGTNNSLVATLDANGKPATQNGTWHEVLRSGLGAPRFTVTSNAENVFSDYNFNQWLLSTTADITGATYFAIVLGFQAATAADTIDFYSVGLCGGDIATRPAPKTIDETLRDCEIFYEKSFASDVIPPVVALDNALVRDQSAYNTGAEYKMVTGNFSIEFKTLKRTDNSNVDIYNPDTGTIDQVRGFVWGGDSGTPGTGSITVSTLWVPTISNKGAFYTVAGYNESVVDPTIGGGWASGSIRFHYVADDRLGIVL